MYDQALLSELVESLNGRYYGKYRGIVVENNDALEGRGRLRVRVPAVLGDDAAWALPCVPYAGDGVGFKFLPDVGAGVWVEFEGGDINYPIWVGCFWAENQLPRADALPNIKLIQTKQVTLRIDDSTGTIELYNASGTKLVLSPTEIKQEGISVVCNANGKKTTLNAIHFDVHDGALTVI
jgi:uncharacterized protein involved in type VI secretion and phage assembly